MNSWLDFYTTVLIGLRIFTNIFLNNWDDCFWKCNFFLDFCLLLNDLVKLFLLIHCIFQKKLTLSKMSLVLKIISFVISVASLHHHNAWAVWLNFFLAYKVCKRLKIVGLIKAFMYVLKMYWKYWIQFENLRCIYDFQLNYLVHSLFGSRIKFW